MLPQCDARTVPFHRSRPEGRADVPAPLRELRSVTICSATLGEDGKTEPPLGPLYVAAAFEREGVGVDFRDFQLAPGAHGLSGEALAAFLSGHHEAIGISCFIDMLPAVIDACRRLHASRPDTFFLLGGPGPSAEAAAILDTYPWISAVVRGEGDETVRDWLEMLRAGQARPVPGMVYRHAGGLVDGGTRSRTRDLGALGVPAYHLVEWGRYTHARLITMRGCAYRCSFCDVAALWGNRSVYRDLEDTVAEIEMLRDRYGSRAVAIVDDTFVMNRDRVRAFCRMLLERRCEIEWGCFGRINLMTPALVELMARAGCRAVFYGIDSGSQRVLDRTVKRVRAEDIRPVVEMSARCFDKVEASFIWGYPFESLKDFEKTLDLAAELSMLAPVVNVQMHLLSPLPLSPVYREFQGRLDAPEPEDRRWLLLPSLLLDERAGVVGEIVRRSPHLYPGFFTFPTPAKRAKRRLLERTMRALDRTIGATVLDPAVGQLLERDDREVEQALLTAETHPSDRVGVGLAVGFFRRARRRAAFRDGRLPEGTRGPALVRDQHTAATQV